MGNGFGQKVRASREQIDFIARSVSELSDWEMAIFHLRFCNDYTLSEISFFSGISQRLIQKILDEGIHRLRLNYLIEFSMPKRWRGHM